MKISGHCTHGVLCVSEHVYIWLLSFHVCVCLSHMVYTIHIHVYTSEDKKTVFMKPSLEKKNLLGILEVLVARLSP